MNKPHIVNEPLVIMFRADDDDRVLCHLYPGSFGYREYGLLICDLVRHVATAFEVDESAVWEWADRERAEPTTKLAGGPLQ